MSAPLPRRAFSLSIRDAGFSLIEMLVVIAILATLAGLMTYNFARSDVRRQAVRLAAEELAATFRKARVLAMERKSVHGVVFHLQNQPGSSGIVLNNRSGGHWYRILGPSPATAVDRSQTFDDLPVLANPGYMMKPHNVLEVGELIDQAWVEDPHVLSAGKVRILALTDMDYGDTGNVSSAYRTTASHASYPRPWFGWYDAAAKRLYPWGGYDPAIPGSGFFYWGVSRTQSGITIATADPEPIGSMNPVARVLDHWMVGQHNYTYNDMLIPSHPKADTLYQADTPRALINASWRDCSLAFLSTGEVRWGYWMPTRHGPWMTDGITRGTLDPVKRGVHDRSNGTRGGYIGDINQRTQTEAGTFDRDSGGWFITLAPDSPHDQDRFNTADEALASIFPMYRVFVSHLGEVKVVSVSRKADFQGLSAFPPNAGWWSNATNMRKNFPADRYVDGTVLGPSNQGWGVAQGRPITDFVTPTMLSERQVWMK